MSAFAVVSSLAMRGIFGSTVVFALFVLIRGLRREMPSELIESPRRVSPFDERVWPFLLAGFGMFTSLGFIHIVTGFLVHDRFSRASDRAGLATGAALLSAGIGMVIAQAIVVPRSGWPPAKILRVGGATALVGFLVLTIDGPMIMFFLSITFVGFGLGLTMPGFTAGASLMVDREEQGGLAGLTGATAGLTFVVAPTAGTSLYSWSQSAPIIVGAVIMALVTAFVFLHPRFAAANSDRKV